MRSTHNRRKGQRAGVLLMVIGIGLMMWFTTQDATVTDDGTLVEPFGAWATGSGLFLTGTAIYVADSVVAALSRRRNR